MDSLKKLLWSDLPRFQLWGAGIGAALGLLLLLGAVQLYLDFRQILTNEREENRQFLQINKRVSFLNTLAGAATFLEEEIEAWDDQPYVRSVARFTSNQYKVSAASPRMGFYTELFFEAVPDEYLDVELPAFRWEKGDRELPVILSRDYLALYNFGFAPSQGLPQFSPGTIRKVSFDIYLGEGGKRQKMTGRIVGFSDRFNSILVPLEFMKWANATLGQEAEKPPSRLLLEVTDPSNRALRRRLEEENLEVSSGQLIGQQVIGMFRVSTLLLIGVGGLILFLSMLIFYLNFRLLVARSRREIIRLLELGYRSRTLSDFLGRRMGIFYLYVGALSLAGLLLGHWLLAGWLDSQGLDVARMLSWITLLLAILLPAGIYLATIQGIRRQIEQEDG